MLATACFILLTKVFWGRLKEMRVAYVRNSQNGNRINIFFPTVSHSNFPKLYSYLRYLYPLKMKLIISKRGNF